MFLYGLPVLTKRIALFGSTCCSGSNISGASVKGDARVDERAAKQSFSESTASLIVDSKSDPIFYSHCVVGRVSRMWCGQVEANPHRGLLRTNLVERRLET